MAFQARRKYCFFKGVWLASFRIYWTSCFLKGFSNLPTPPSATPSLKSWGAGPPRAPKGPIGPKRAHGRAGGRPDGWASKTRADGKTGQTGARPGRGSRWRFFFFACLLSALPTQERSWGTSKRGGKTIPTEVGKNAHPGEVERCSACELHEACCCCCCNGRGRLERQSQGKSWVKIHAHKNKMQKLKN